MPKKHVPSPYKIIILFLSVPILTALSFAQEKKEIDPSDPTKIYSYAGAGLKYTDYTNGEHMWETRATGNLGLTDQDMVMFELGYGWHSGDSVRGTNSDVTNARLRWFHLFNMNYDVISGYRGWATQIDLQLAGQLKGTDGQNTIALGALPAYGINKQFSFFLPLNLVNTWDKDFKKWNGAGISVAPLLVYTTDKLWPGAYFQLWPNYTYFLAGELDSEGAGAVDVTTGGPITDTITWSVTFQKNIDKDLRAFRRERDSGLKNDWNVFSNVTMYF